MVSAFGTPGKLEKFHMLSCVGFPESGGEHSAFYPPVKPLQGKSNVACSSVSGEGGASKSFPECDGGRGRERYLPPTTGVPIEAVRRQSGIAASQKLLKQSLGEAVVLPQLNRIIPSPGIHQTTCPLLWIVAHEL